MLDLCNEFGHKLERNRSQKHQVEFLIRHTAKLTTLLQSAHKEFLLVNPSDQASRYHAMKRELVEDVNNIVEQLDARVHLRSRYGFLLARWRPTTFYWELVIMLRKLAVELFASHLCAAPASDPPELGLPRVDLRPLPRPSPPSPLPPPPPPPPPASP